RLPEGTERLYGEGRAAGQEDGAASPAGGRHPASGRANVQAHPGWYGRRNRRGGTRPLIDAGPGRRVCLRKSVRTVFQLRPHELLAGITGCGSVVLVLLSQSGPPFLCSRSSAVAAIAVNRLRKRCRR